MADINGFLQKKVAGVKTLYWIGGFVIILAVVAWKMKPSTGTDSGDNTATDEAATGAAPTPNPYDSLGTNGTVTVQQLGPSQDTSAPVVKTNDDWVNEGAIWLETNNSVSGSVALSALMKYINGQDRTYDEQKLVDAWFKQNGPPPDGVAEGGTVASQPAIRQIATLPGYHTVTGSNDNLYQLLSKMYYGFSNQETIDFLQGKNIDRIGNDPLPVGTKVLIPVYAAPKYYYVPKNVATMNSADIAAKNGISVAALQAMNNVSYTVWKSGQKVRVG